MDENKRIRIALVDDLPFYREGIKQILQSEASFEIVGEGTQQQVPTLIEETDPELIIITIDIAQENQLEFVQQVVVDNPDLKVAILFNNHDKMKIIRMIESDIRGYLLQEMDTDSFIKAIHLMCEGITYLHPKVTHKLIEETKGILMLGGNRSIIGSESKVPELLTKREHEILRLLAKGKTNKEIATVLPITEGTVAKYISMILNKLDVHDRTQAVIKAVNKGWITNEDEKVT